MLQSITLLTLIIQGQRIALEYIITWQFTFKKNNSHFKKWPKQSEISCYENTIENATPGACLFCYQIRRESVDKKQPYLP